LKIEVSFSGNSGKLPASKLHTLSEAIAEYVPDGSTVAASLSLEALIPFAAAHEIIRQKRRNLTLVGPISDVLFDQLVGAGCVRRICAAWVGNVITGSCYNFRRAVESGRLQMEDHSNLTVAMALRAAALGVPFLPLRSALGSDLFTTNARLKRMTCPFTGETLAAVAALRPDVALIHVQRADEFGNAHAWGNLGVARDACLASRHVVITAEQIVAPEVISSDPNRVVTPGFKVNAVAHAPWGGHPSPVPGFYNRDHQAFIDYRNDSRSPQGFEAWQGRWVDGCRDRSDYLSLLAEERRQALAITRHVWSEPVDFGY
jgi:glutaconate CoA-transferase subunit A